VKRIKPEKKESRQILPVERRLTVCGFPWHGDENKSVNMKFYSSQKRPRIGLALSGGSALGTLHIGVLQALENNQIPIDCISGTSAGAIVAACYAFGVPVNKLVERAQSLSWYKLSGLSYSRMGLASTKTIGKMMEGIIGPVNIEDAKIPLAIVATNIKNGEKVVFKKGSVSQAIMASVSIPGLFAPVRIDGLQLVDGGVIENLPLLTLNDFGPDIKIGVNLARWRTYKEPANAIDVVLNTFDVMTQRQSIAHSQAAEIIIEPHLEKYTSSDFKKAAELIAEGYRATALVIPKIKQKLETKPVRARVPESTNLFRRFIDWLKR
jgi:NTE family protein